MGGGGGDGGYEDDDGGGDWKGDNDNDNESGSGGKKHWFSPVEETKKIKEKQLLDQKKNFSNCVVQKQFILSHIPSYNTLLFTAVYKIC